MEKKNKINQEKQITGKQNKEILIHFQCGACQKWWTIGDASAKQKSWYCPWCGIKQVFKLDK